jgi:hypothetical protein
MGDISPTGVRRAGRAGSARTSTALSPASAGSRSAWRCSRAVQTSRKDTTTTPRGKLPPVKSTSARPRASTGTRLWATGVPVSADTKARPKAGTDRSPDGSHSGTARTTPSASGSATVWPTFVSVGALGDATGGVDGAPDGRTETTSTLWAAWARSASLEAPPRPGALG